VPVYTKPAILGLPPTAVLTKQEMDFRANLLNPNNDLFWTARGLIRPPVLADALAQGHAILKYEGHLTQKQGGRRLSAQYGRSGATSAANAAPALPLSFGAAVVAPSSVAAAVQGSWRSAPPSAPAALPTNPACVTKEDMDIRANQLNPNNDVFWSSRGLIRPSVLAEALAQGHAILQMEGHLTQTQTHKTRGRLNSQPALFTNNDLGRPADTRRSISGQGLPGSSGGGLGGGSGRMGSGRPDNSQLPMAMRRRASTTGSMMNRPPALDGSVTKDEVDLRANLMNPNNSVFWTSRGLTRPTDLQEALAKGHAVLEAEGHITHNTGGRSKSWNRRGSRTELHAPPAVSPLVAAAQRQWSTPFLAPNAGATMPPTSLSARPGGLPGAAWVTGPAPSAAAGSASRHPDWQSNALQRRRYSLPPPGFELFTPPSHFALFRPPVAPQKQQQAMQQKQAMPFIKEGAADSEWDKMDSEVINRPLAPHSAAIPIIKPTAADLAAAKRSESASAWVKKAPSADSKKSASVFLRDDKQSTTADASEESKAMKQEDKKLDSTKSDVETKTASAGTAPSEPTTPASATSWSRSPLSSSSDKVGSLAWQLTQVKLRTRRPSEARENEIATKSATA
jgi:hypothetical protein